jgi:hypothetical protein
MRTILHIVFFLCISNALSQAVGYIYEELPENSISNRTVRTHSSLKPEIRITPKDPQKTSFTGLADMNVGIDSSFAFRSGIGFDFTSLPGKGWFIRLAGVQGFGNQENLLAPRSILRFDDPDGYLYTDIRSRISYIPNQIFNFQVGVDHNFLGEGSRSLLLSDYGVSHPFGLIRTQFWQLEYNVLYQFLREGGNKNWESKFAATHHISFNPSKWLNIGIFETVLFQPIDTNLNRGFDVEYLNPVIFYRPQEYAIGSADNVLIGLDISAHFKRHTFYGQLIIDEFSLTELRAKTKWWANKYGLQMGVKGRSANEELFYRLEYNFVRPYTYSHISEELNYGNQGASLAHPYGANFMEILAEAKYQKEKWLFKLFTSYTLGSRDQGPLSFGGDIYRSYVERPYEYGHYVGQGEQVNRSKLLLSAAYRIMEKGNLNAFFEGHLNYEVQGNSFVPAAVIGVRSMLWNDYRNY